MRIVKENILSTKLLHSADSVCFTSNGITKKDGTLVMGAGVAKQFRDCFVGIDQRAGTLVKQYGNICQIVQSTYIGGTPLNILTFPTKYHWKDPSSLKLIEQSAFELIKLTNQYGWKLVFLPAPGVGLGGLDFNKEVKPMLEKIFDQRFVITFWPEPQKGKV